MSTDASKEQAGDLGFIDKDATLDAAFVRGCLAAAKDAPTGVVEGTDGTFRIGRVTEIVAPVDDATLASQVNDAGISLDDFRAALGRDVTRTKLSDAVLAAVPGPGPAARGRRRSSSRSRRPSTGSPTARRRTRPRSASATSSTRPTTTPQPAAPLPADDPAWAKAEHEAKAT